MLRNILPSSIKVGRGEDGQTLVRKKQFSVDERNRLLALGRTFPRPHPGEINVLSLLHFLNSLSEEVKTFREWYGPEYWCPDRDQNTRDYNSETVYYTVNYLIWDYLYNNDSLNRGENYYIQYIEAYEIYLNEVSSKEQYIASLRNKVSQLKNKKDNILARNTTPQSKRYNEIQRQLHEHISIMSAMIATAEAYSKTIYRYQTPLLNIFADYSDDRKKKQSERIRSCLTTIESRMVWRYISNVSGTHTRYLNRLNKMNLVHENSSEKKFYDKMIENIDTRITQIELVIRGHISHDQYQQLMNTEFLNQEWTFVEPVFENLDSFQIPSEETVLNELKKVRIEMENKAYRLSLRVVLCVFLARINPCKLLWQDN